MPQFVIIDHSVQDTTGHHYEYAMRVLEAAQSAGYRPVLGANVNFRSNQSEPFRVYPVYPLGFWPRMARTGGSTRAVNAIRKAIELCRKIRFRLFFSRIGFLWLIRNEPIAYLKWHPFDSPVAGPLLFCASAPVLLIRFLCQFLIALIPFRQYLRGVASAVWTPARSLAARMADFLSPAGSMAGWRFARRKQKSFAKATLSLLKTLQLCEDDIVFIPTLAEPEMLGLAWCFKKLSSASLPAYHLLFRRNLYEGREPDFDRQEDAILPVRNAFLRFRSSLSGQRVFFYTDTEELSRQFNRLKIFPFRTCPIPHTFPESEHGPVAEPLQVTYLGDARVEKGYQYLPGVVQDLWRSDVRTGKISFVLQSNYNVEPGEPASIVARSQLAGYPEDKVRLILETCTSVEYRQTLLSSAVMLLPYHPDMYYARSSGVLIEALAAGVPVVVPATSWLAKQIADPSYAYLAGLIESSGIKPQRFHSWVREGSDSPLVRHDPSALGVGGEERKAYTWINVPQGVAYLSLSLRLEDTAGAYVTCYTDQVDQQGNRLALGKETLGAGYTEKTVRVLIPIHRAARRIWVALRNAFSDSFITVHDPSIRFLSLAAGQDSIPVSAVGVCFSEETPHAMAAALREVIRNYQHYKDTASAHSHAVYRFHNAPNLIRVLASASHNQDQDARLDMCVAGV